MYDVERIREVAQETEHSGLALAGCTVGSAKPKQDGENDDDANGLIHSIPAHRRLAGNVRHHKQSRHDDRSQPKGAPHSDGTEAAGKEHAEGIGKQHPHQASPIVYPVERPAYAKHAPPNKVADGHPYQGHTQQCGDGCQHAGGEAMDKKTIEDVAYVLKEQRPCRAIEREHLAVAPHLVGTTWPSRNHEHSCQKGEHGHGHGDAAAVPMRATLEEETHKTHHCAKHHHGMEADEATAEEVAQRKASLPTVVVGIANDKT